MNGWTGSWCVLQQLSAIWCQREIMETNEVVQEFWALSSDDPDLEED